MFEQLINEAAARLNLPTGSTSALVRGLLAMMVNERTGGVDGFVDMCRRAGLGDVITSWFGGKEGRPLTPSQVESALGTSALDKLGASSGLTRAAVSSATAYLLPRLIGRLTPNGVLPSRNALLSQISGYVDRPVPAPVHQVERRGWPRWVPWAAAALLALVAWLAFRGPAGTIDPQLTLSNRNGKITYSGLVRDEATRSTIVNALQTTFGEGNVDGTLRVDRNVKRAEWLPHADNLLAVLKTPGTDVALNGNTVSVGGWLSAAQRETIASQLRNIFGEQSTIRSLGDPAAEAVRTANEKAISALGAVGTSGTSASAVVDAMNMAIINFPTGSAEIPADQMAIIRKSADALKQAPAGSMVEIGGHTDNTGEPAANVALSQARADAVRNALVANGVSGAMLTTRGYGASKPVETNDTEYGRFQNRRIEYAVVQ
ncbi:MAG: DUF937 domain-containing protein [Acidobacteria bacterium]|nr:MAG: DUF937 domain-containing protein [Acidobacteriota bacterium]